MDKSLREKLLKRDKIESRYSELFHKVILADQGPSQDDALKDTSKDPHQSIIMRQRKELKQKNTEISRLKEIIEIKKKDSEKLNDEIISLSIENNLTSKRFSELEEEHDKLVKRWVARVQQDVDKLNADFE